MFYASWWSPSKIKGTLKLTKDPFYYGLGHYEDTDGVVWDIRAVIGMGPKPYVNARPVNCYMSYYGTALGDNCSGFHTWDPYYVELIKTGDTANG